ncbi:hypothetical protein RHGRI_006538 [Rhododendron griersonianum]|uniref:Uncharacterized protein n=1 Tax=Rhododendron griersonianum TaxID=479676 RepID=A0AAV6KU12_9ERIC|nr:hypothetical protein RHGRI_006538 [Rhododendron griersonianum]
MVEFVPIGATFLEKIVDYLVDPIKRQFTYMCCFNSNITELEIQLKDLETTRQGVQMGADENRRKVRVVGPDVEAWLNRANGVTTEVERIIQDKAKVKERCLNGWCPNLKQRYSLSRKAVKKTKVVVDIKVDGVQYTQSSYSPPPASLETITNRDFTGFESRRLIMEEIIKALKHDEINLIGVCGMGGLGKTTLVNEVARRAKEDSHFDDVAIAVVSQEPNLTDVQACIAEMLGLKNLHDMKSPIVRADLLRRRLLQDNKKVLIILDDIWAEFDLKAMGIPLEGADKNIKVLYTSRTRDLWHDLRTKKEIPLEILSKDEAWQLFREKAGDSVDAPDLQPIAKQIVDECGCLPLALVLIGSALSKKSGRNAIKEIWEGMLDRLTCATSTPVDERLYSRLELSYECLEDEEAKRLFLLCCLFQEDEDISIEDLARYGLGLSLFDGINEMEKVRHRVFLIVDDLKSRYLLLDSEEEEKEWVKVHDVVRDMGISIASKNKFALVIHGEVSEWPKKDTYKHYTCISLISRKITELPRGLTSPNLEFLLLDCKKLKELPCNFFEGMGELKVLVLKNFEGILSLPSSTRNLHTLCISFFNGKLDNVSEFGGLFSLKTLSFRISRMEELPEEIGELVYLRLLDLRGNQRLKRIPPNVISRLVDLEELYISEFTDWEGEGKEEEGRNANLRELELLSNLSTLEIGIRSDVNIPKVRIFSKLKIYTVVIVQDDDKEMDADRDMDSEIGDSYYHLFCDRVFKVGVEMYNLFSKCKRVFMVGSSIPIPSNRGGIDSLLRSSDCLLLEGKGCNDLVQALLLWYGVDGLQQLKLLRIRRCDTPECLANTINPVHQPIAHAPAIFPFLEGLDLIRLVNLREICGGPVPARSFGELTFIRVGNCGRLRNLFQLPIVGCLPQLKRLIISSCGMMEEVFWKDQQQDVHAAANIIEFPKLEVLKLEKLPSLMRFCRGIDQIDFPQLKKLFLKDIPQVSLPNLEVLRVDKLENLERLEYRPLLVGSFSKLNKIFLRDCGKLLCVIPSQFLPMLRELQELTVESCNSLEVVFELEGLESNEPNPEISKRYPVGIKYIQRLKIHNCNSLRYVFAPTRTKSIPQLRELKVLSCEMVSRIVAEENELGESSVDEVEFPQLESLELLDLPKLLSFFPNVNTTTLAKSIDHYHNPLQPQPLFNEKNVSDLWSSELPTSSFSKLKKLNVRGFANLRRTFHPSMVGGLANLSELVIIDCLKMEGVVYWEEEIEDGQGRKVEKTMFPLLRKLQLLRLPNLVSFFPDAHGSGNTTTLAKLTDNYHNPLQPQPLFNEKVAFPCLKYLGLCGLQNVSDLWGSELPTSSFFKLKNLQATDSASLIRNFPCILWIDDLNNTTQGLQEVARLLYTNYGDGVLALGSSGTMMGWKWPSEERLLNSMRLVLKATARVLPDSGLAITNDVTGVNLDEVVPCMALSGNYGDIISACGGAISLFKDSTWEVNRTFMPPPPASTFLASYPGGYADIVAIGMEDSTIRIYNHWGDEVIKSEMKGHKKHITGLAFSTNLNILVSSGADAKLCIWRMDTWEHLKSVSIQLPAGKACNGDTRVEFHSDRIRLLVSHETQLAIYDASEMVRIRQWVPQDVLTAQISFAVYSCDSQLVYTSFCDGNIGMFNADSLTLAHHIVPSIYLSPAMLRGGQAVYPRVVAAHPEKPNQFAIGFTNGFVLLMEPGESKGKWGLSPSIDNGMLNDRTASSSNTINHTPDQINGDGPMARSIEKPKTLDDVTDKSKPWKVAETQCQLVVMPDSTDEAHKVACLLYRNGCEILALGCNGALRLWRRLVLKATASVVPQQWQPASGLAMTNDVTGVNLEEAVPYMALSKYRNIISACGGEVSLFNTETFKVESELKGHEKRITGLAFSTNHNILVSSGADAQFCIWSIKTWEHLKSVPIQLPAGKACNGNTTVQFHSDQICLLVSHETQLVIYDAVKMDHIHQVEITPHSLLLRLCITNFKSNGACSFEVLKNLAHGRSPTNFLDLSLYSLYLKTSLNTQTKQGHDFYFACMQWVPQDVLPAPISFAAYSCDSQLVYTSFCDGNIGVFDADSLTPTHRIAPSAYSPTLSSGSHAVYPLVVATHPWKPNQFAIGLTNGSVIVMEPQESEGKWGLSSNTSNHAPNQRKEEEELDENEDEEDQEEKRKKEEEEKEKKEKELNLDEDEFKCSNPSLLPEAGKRRSIEEPIVKIEMLTPKDYVGTLMDLAQKRRGEFKKEMKFITENRALITHMLPLAEDVITVDGRRWDKVIVSKEEADAILKIPISKFQREDLLVWHYTSNDASHPSSTDSSHRQVIERRVLVREDLRCERKARDKDRDER